MQMIDRRENTVLNICFDLKLHSVGPNVFAFSSGTPKSGVFLHRKLMVPIPTKDIGLKSPHRPYEDK